MKLEYISKSQEYDSSGTASHTKVVLGNIDGAIYPIFLPADKINLSNTELLDLALDVIYQDNFPMKAENEKFNVLGNKIAEYDVVIEKSQNTIKELQKVTKRAEEGISKNKETVDNAVVELTELVTGVLAMIMPQTEGEEDGETDEELTE